MPESLSQFYENELRPIPIQLNTLDELLKLFRANIRQCAAQIQKESPSKSHYDGHGFFTGDLGIALAFVRLEHQAPSLRDTFETSEPLPDFHSLALERIPTHGPDLPNAIGKLSPLASGSPVSAAVARIIAIATSAARSKTSEISQSDIFCLQEAVELALSHGPLVFYNNHDLGGDEVLFGRAGLLYAILNLRAHTFDSVTERVLSAVFESVPKLVDAIITAGIQGAKNYRDQHGEQDALPLMWPWIPGYFGLGAVHGMTGILTVLLGCLREELDSNASRNYLPLIAETISGLCRICIANDGHLPMSIPPFPSKRSSPLVQLCHGAPGILLLLGMARRNDYLTLAYWQPEWDQATRLATERVWKEGLLSKGGGLGHGIAGNAWPLLLLHDSFEYGTKVMDRAKRNYMERTKLGGTYRSLHRCTNR